MPNGEQRLQEYDKQAQEYFELAKISEQQIAGYTERIDKIYSSWQVRNLRLMPWMQNYAEPTAKAFMWIEGIKPNLIGATDELEKNLYYYNIYSVVPATVVTGSASSLDEVLDMYPMPSSLSEAERTTIKETITDMISYGAAPPEDFLAQAAAELELPALAAPTPVTPFVPVGLHQLSTDEIVKALTTERIPSPVMSQEAWAELLKGMGYSDADLEATEYNRAEAERLALEWQEQANMLESFKSGLSEMPDYKLADMLKDMATQPGLALLDTTQFYFDLTSRPLSGSLYRHFIPDIEAEYQRLKQTESTWEALNHAWMNWDYNWFIKYVLMEGLCDPLTYVGWGIATRITKPLGRVGRLVGAAERGAQELFEMPFDMLKVGWRKIPKTAAQRALTQQHHAGQTLRKFLERYSGKHLIKLSMSEIDDAAKAASKFALAHPQSDDLAALAGRELLKHTPIGPDDVASWTTRLGTSLGPDDVTRVTIENTENIFEDYFMRSMITEKETAARLLKVLSITDTSDAKLRVAQRLLQDRGNRIKAGVTAFAKADTPFDAMQAVMRRNYKIAIKIEDSAAYLSRMEAGRMTVLLHGVEVKTQALWKDVIDRKIVRPFAEAYLTFGMYGPLNVAEDYCRSILGGVIPRRMNVETWQRLSWGLSVDDDLSRYGLSEMTGYLAREGAEDTWNNWVLQLAFGGQKKWANKAYTAMVRKPGAYGMDVRRNFIGRRYEQLFREQGGDVVEALLKAGPKTPRLSGKLVKQLEAEVYRMKTTLQPDNIRGLKSVFTHKKLTRAEVQNTMSQFPDMPPAARQHIIKAYDSGELFKDIDGSMKFASDILVDDFVRSPEYATAQIHALTKELMALEVTNPQEMAETIRMVQIMCDSYDALPHQVVAQATVRSRGLPLAQRKGAFNRDFDLLYKFIDDAGVDIESAIAKVRNAIPRLAPNDDYVTRSNRLLDIMASRKEYAAEFRAQNMALRREIFESISPKERTGKFWQDFYEQMDTDWGVFEIKDAELFGLQVQAVESLDLVSGIKPFSRPVLSITDRALSPQDIASLIGCRGDDISKALLEVMAVNSKPRFTAYVMAKVRPGDVGFTKEAVGAVYDQIVGSLYIKPETFSYITRCKMQTEGLRKELWALHNSKIYPDDELKQIYKYLDDTADAVDNLAYKEVAAAPGEVVTGYRAGPIRKTTGLKASEGEGLYVAKTRTAAEFWGEPSDVKYMKPRNPLIVDEEPLYLLHEMDEIFDPIKASDSEWLKINKQATIDAGATRELAATREWQAFRNKISKNISDISKDKGYDAITITSGGQTWDVLIDESLWKLPKVVAKPIQFNKIAGISIDSKDKPLFNAIDDIVKDYITKHGEVSRYDIPLYKLAQQAGIKFNSQEMVDFVQDVMLGKYKFIEKGYGAGWAGGTGRAPKAKILSMYKDNITGKYKLYDAKAKASGISAATHKIETTHSQLYLTDKYAIERGLHPSIIAKAVTPEVTAAKVLKPEFTKLDDVRQSAMDEAHKWYYKEYPDYTNANAFDAMMKSIFPYWTYESQRYFWLPRSFIRHPGTFTAFERWQNNTDYGYIHIPNTSVDTNPFRGTIYGTLTTRLTRRDFPEYYDAYPPAGELVEFMDYISRFGFYPGIHISAPLSALGGMEAQLGETMPAVWKTPLMAAIAMFPESESVKFISERIFGDRFRDYVTILMVNKRGGDGSLLWTKMKEGVELTPEEQQSWTDSRREAAKYGVGMEQFGLFRLRTDEQYKVYEEASKVIEDMTGFTSEQQKWLRMHGYRVWDMVGGLSFTQQAILQEMDYYRWVGMVTPLLPSRQQGEYRQIELFWDDVKNFTEKQYQGKLDLQRDLVGGIIGPDEYSNRVREIYSTQRSYIDELKTSNLYKGVPVTFEERKEMLEKHGKVVPVLHPSKELLNLYFEIELTQKIDEETGEKVWDWDSFWAMREAVEAAVPEEYKQEWDDYLIRNTTPLEQIRRRVSQEYFRSYNRVWEQVLLTQYNETEQHLIKEWYSLRRRGISLDRQADISATVRDNGKQLISNFQSDVSEARKALRYANPLLDAWLYYWGRTTSFLTPEANEAYPQICSETARQI